METVYYIILAFLALFLVGPVSGGLISLHLVHHLDIR